MRLSIWIIFWQWLRWYNFFFKKYSIYYKSNVLERFSSENLVKITCNLDYDHNALFLFLTASSIGVINKAKMVIRTPDYEIVHM